VVQIDAHGDMRFEYEGSHHNHACVMRRVLEMGLPTLPVTQLCIPRNRQAHPLRGVGRIHQAGFA